MILNSRIFVIVLGLSVFPCGLLSAQIILEDTIQRISLNNASFENDEGGTKLPSSWEPCSDNTILPDVQPGSYGVHLVPINGKKYLSLAAHDDGKTEMIKQPLSQPLKAGQCYRLSVFLAKSEKYENQSFLKGNLVLFEKPLKLIVWGLSRRDSCVFNSENWLTETKPVHHNRWKKYVFYIQPSQDCEAVVFQAAHVADKIYNGNLLLDNISPIVSLPCNDLKLSEGTVPSSKKAYLLIQFISEMIINNAAQLKFQKKRVHFEHDGYSQTVAINAKNIEIIGNEYFDRILEVFQRYNQYKLVIRLKNKDRMAKERVVYLYNYIFKKGILKAQQIDIQRYKPKDEEYNWTYENDEWAISFDNL